jgi:hypothetical protein
VTRGRGLFVALTRRRLNCGGFFFGGRPPDAMYRYIAGHRDDPNPFLWTKPADRIL